MAKLAARRRFQAVRRGFAAVRACFLVGLIAVSWSPHAGAAVVGVKHVVVIGCDGMSPDGVRKANTPQIDRLMGQGAYTMHARAVMPTSSSPNWASMIMGAGPEQHGVTSNDWEPDSSDVAPTALGPGGIFPTIFSVLRMQRPSATTACFHDWDGFGRLFERETVDHIADTDGPRDTAAQAVAYFKEKKPTFTFIQLDHVDHAGHEHGWGTAGYYAAVEEADRRVGEVIEGLAAADMLAETVILVTSDHGGKGKGHGGATMEELEIPWIISGPGIAAGTEIRTRVDIYDTAATIAHIFGLAPPAAWIARPVQTAFAHALP